MQKATGKTRLLTALFTLCMLLSLAPISAFADGVNYIQKVHVTHEYIDYKAGETPRATASVTEGNCTVAYEYWRELYQKEEGGVWSGTGRYWYSAPDKMASLSEDKRITSFEAGHCYSYNIVLRTDSGYFFSDDETVVSVGEYEWGTPSSSTNLEIKKMSTELRIYSPYSLDLPDESQPSAIPSAAIENAKFNYQPGDAPQAAAWVAETDTDKYEIAYECWQQFENNNPVAAWYSDNGSHGSLPTITAFESGKTYVYSLMLKPKDGYSFSSETVITVNGQKVSAPFVGGSMYIPSIKTITMPTVTVIDVVEINGVPVSFQDGDKPVFTGKVPDGANYAYRCEWWELNSTTGAMSTDFGNFYENKITAFEAGKTYHYGVYVTTYGDVGNVRYVFGPDTKLKINGEFVNYTRYEGDTSDSSDGTLWVLTDLAMTPSSTPHSHSYGTAWKYDETNHWHECACGDTADKASHTFKWVTDKEATAAEKGSKHEECTVCGYKKAAVEIPAAGSVTKPTAPTDKPRNTASPRTGDTGSLALWITLLFVSCGAAISTTVGRKKYNR